MWKKSEIVYNNKNNILLGANASFKITSKINAYAQFMADDFSNETKLGNAIGFQARKVRDVSFVQQIICVQVDIKSRFSQFYFASKTQIYQGIPIGFGFKTTHVILIESRGQIQSGETIFEPVFDIVFGSNGVIPIICRNQR